MDRHGDRLAGHVVFGGEPALVNLLRLAGVAEIDDDVRLGGIKVGRGIVEGDVGVLPDADQAQIDGFGRQGLPSRLSSPESSASPLTSVTCLSRTLSINRLLRYLRKLAGWDSGSATYSSRWNISTLVQSISLFKSASNNSN